MSAANGQRMRFHSRSDAWLAAWSIGGLLFCTLLVVAAIFTGRYSLATFDLILVLVNGAVLASVVSRRAWR